MSGGLLRVEIEEKRHEKTVKRFKQGFPAKFIQSWINVILCNEEKPDVGVLYEGQRLCSGWCGFVWVHSYNASLCLDCSASYGPILAHIPSRHPFHHQICSKATGVGWEGVGYCIFLSFFEENLVSSACLTTLWPNVPFSYSWITLVTSCPRRNMFHLCSM